MHIDASQHAVGAVLLQWEEGEQHPRPVCFLSRKFQGAQYHYDARNAESLAAMFLRRTYLLGPFYCGFLLFLYVQGVVSYSVT